METSREEQHSVSSEEDDERKFKEAREKCAWLEQELASHSAREQQLEKKLEKLTANGVFGERQEGDGAAAQDTSTTTASMEERLRSLQADKDRILSVMNEKSRESSSLKAEVHRLLGVIAQERQAAAKLRREQQVVQESDDVELTRQALRNLSQLVRDRELEELLEERESLAQRAALADEEQGHLKVALQQKDRELSDALAQVDKLTLDLGLLRLEVDSSTQKLEEKNSALLAAREEALALRQRIVELQSAVQRFEHTQPESSESSVQHWQTQAEQYQKQVHELQLKEAKLSKELERLRTHLIQMEESYTREALEAEAREESLRSRLIKLEEWARVSESAAQNATEQASQQVDNLVQQLAQAQSQQAALAEELRHSKASLTNLQSVLDHFPDRLVSREKDREIQLLRSSYESQLCLEREKSQQLISLVTQKQEQLEGSRDALEAAERLSQQLDRREEVIATLKQQCE
ncbi:hypothetical protein MRX96_021320 [Rhipicephalus microplus]